NLVKIMQKEEQELDIALAKISFNNYQARAEHLQKIIDVKNSINDNKNIIQQIITPTVFYCKDHTHYSIPKISEVLRLNVRPVLSNNDGSINLKDLQKELLLHLGAYPNSGVIVVANIGTTITGAIDDVPKINKILCEIIPSHNFTIHMDGALAGFVLPI